MFDFIYKYLEFGIIDCFCYIGDVKGSLVERIVDKFCFLELVMFVIFGYFSYVWIDIEKFLFVCVVYIGVEEYFK